MSKTQIYIKNKGFAKGHAFIAVNHRKKHYIYGAIHIIKDVEKIEETIYIQKMIEISKISRKLDSKGYSEVTANEFNKNI